MATLRTTLNLRIKPEDRGLIDRAAHLKGKNRTDFILDAARIAAEETLLEQIVISISSKEAYTEFLSKLDRAPKPSKRLRKTMTTLAPWDKK